MQSGKIFVNASRLELSWAPGSRPLVVPVFLPYLGCRGRCVFCNQSLQTGVAMPAPDSLARLLREHGDSLAQRRGEKRPQIAFYGGTFTAIPDWAWNQCLDWAISLTKRGLISGFRCSTRPDALAARRLRDLKAAGCQLVELGIQSYDAHALALAERGHTAADALAAATTLHAASLAHGVQLMPGMPGVSPLVAMNDLHTAIAGGAACLRFYPCVVMENTRLAQLWREGRYEPWSIDTAVVALARMWLLAFRHNIPVIRMGLAPQPGLASSILAGPAHAALGSRVMAAALYICLGGFLAHSHGERFVVRLPARLQGFFWGWRGELAEKWRNIGVSRANVYYWQKDVIEISRAPGRG